MKTSVSAFLLLFLIEIGSSQLFQYDFSSRGSCLAPYKAAVEGCNIKTGSYFPSAAEQQCVCQTNPTFEKDIMNCLMAWVDPSVSNGGFSGELETVSWYQERIGCGFHPTSTANLTSTDLTCRSIFETIEICGSDTNSTCICGYKFLWDGQMGGVGRVMDCPKAIEQAGDTALGARARSWSTFACGPSPWVYPWLGIQGSGTRTSTATTTTRTSTSKDAAPRATGVGIEYVVVVLAVAGMM